MSKAKPKVKALPPAKLPTEGCGCPCGRLDKVCRFGQARICLHHACLSGWLFVLARKMSSTFSAVRRISSRGPSTWREFLDHTVAYFWRRVAEGNANGISVFDLDNAIQAYDVRYRGHTVETPTDMSEPETCDTERDCTDESAWTPKAMAQYVADPYTHRAPIVALLETRIRDPLLALYWAGELTIREACLLADTSLEAWEVYSTRAMEEVRGEVQTQSQAL